MNYVEEKDEATNSVRVTFLYQPTSGIAPSSFGVNVARIACIVRFIGWRLKISTPLHSVLLFTSQNKNDIKN